MMIEEMLRDMLVMGIGGSLYILWWAVVHIEVVLYGLAVAVVFLQILWIWDNSAGFRSAGAARRVACVVAALALIALAVQASNEG
jgi:hypothetical protein